MRSLLRKPEKKDREGNWAIQAFGDASPKEIIKPKSIRFLIVPTAPILWENPVRPENALLRTFLKLNPQ